MKRVMLVLLVCALLVGLAACVTATIRKVAFDLCLREKISATDWHLDLNWDRSGLEDSAKSKLFQLKSECLEEVKGNPLTEVDDHR
jgi:hypothetical protein